MWFDIATVVLVLGCATYIACLVKGCIRDINRRMDDSETLLIWLEEYTRKNRHAVANLTEALTLVFPEIKSRLGGMATTVVPTDLQDEDVA